MRIRFQADADLNEDIVTGVIRREPGVDFRTAADAELKGVLDDRVLAVAAREGRVLITHDRKTMPAHFAEFIEGGRQSPGVLIVLQRAAVAAVIEELLLIWAASEAEEYADRIYEIPF